MVGLQIWVIVVGSRPADRGGVWYHPRQDQNMPTSKRSGSKARLKLVRVGNETVLLLRFVGRTEYSTKAFPARIREQVPSDRVAFDGEVWRVRGDAAVKSAVQSVIESCNAVYDPDLLHLELGALPNPWPIPEE